MKRLFIPTLSLLLTPCALPAQTASAEPDSLIQKYIHFSKSDHAALQRGDPAARLIDASDPSEIALFGIVRVKISGRELVDRFRDIAKFKQSKEVLEVGKFHLPPSPEDLESLTLEAEDIQAMKDCRAGDCKLKLGGKMMQLMHTEVDWQAADQQMQATRLYRKTLLEYAASYLERGNDALIQYDDKQVPTRLADETRSILSASPYLHQYAPALLKYLQDFPRAQPPEAENLLYWSKEKFGFKAVISITHVTIYRPAGSPWSFIASKQIYADHYFQGSLGLTMFLDSPQTGSASSGFLMYLNRSRVDVGGGIFRGLLRFFVKRRVLDGLDKYLRLVKGRLESTSSAVERGSSGPPVVAGRFRLAHWTAPRLRTSAISNRDF
jgi:hypothetical protein